MAHTRASGLDIVNAEASILMVTVVAIGTGNIVSYSNLTKKAKDQLEPWIDYVVGEAKDLMREGHDLYAAADLAASRFEAEEWHDEILRRLRKGAGGKKFLKN